MGPSSSSLMNIVVRVQAQRAISTLNALNINLQKIETAGMGAGTVMDAIAGASRGFAAALGGASAEAANLARALAQMDRSSTRLPGKLLSTGTAAQAASAGMGAMVVQARALSTVMGPLAVQMTMFANSYAAVTKAAQAAAIQQAKADAVRQQSAIKTAEAIRVSALREQTARGNAAAAAARAAAGVSAAQAREQAANATASAAVVRAEEIKQAARYKTAAAAATASAQIAAAEARQAAAAQASAAAQARAATAGAGAGAAAAAAGGLGAGAAGASAMSRFTQSINGADSALGRLSKSMQTNGSRAQWMGRQLMVNLSMPLGALAAGATAFYYQQEKAFTYLAKVYDGAASDLGDFGGEIGRVTEGLNMLSQYFGVNREEVYMVAESWASLGMTGGALTKAVQNTYEAALLGNMDLEQATKGLIAIQAQFRISMEDSTQAIAEMNAIANQGPTELDGLIDAMSRTGAVAHAAGLSVSQTAGMIEEMAPATGTAIQAGNGLKSMIASITAPDKETTAWLGQLGLDAERWVAESVPVIERIGEMADMYDRLTDPGKTTFAVEVGGKWQYGRLTQLLDMFNESQGEYQKAQRASGEATNDSSKAMIVYERELAKMMDSDFIKFNQAWQMIKNSMADAIKPMIPAIIQFIQVIAGMFKWFSELSPVTRKWVMTVAAVFIVLGPVVMLVSTLGLMLGMLGMAFVRVVPLIMGFGKALIWAMTGGMFFKNNAVAAGLAKITGAFALARARILAIWTSLWVSSGRVAAGGAAANSGIIQVFLASLPARFAAASARISAGWTAMWAYLARVSGAGSMASSGVIGRFLGAVAGWFRTAGTRIAGIWTATWAAVARISAAGGAAASGVIGRFLVLAATMFRSGGTRIVTTWAAMWALMTKISIAGALATGKAAVMGLVRALIMPILSAIGTAVAAIAAFVGMPVWAVAAIIAALVAAGVAIYKWRDQIGGAIKGAAEWFGRLPGAIARSLRSALDVIVRFAKAARDWLGNALNPWKRHSPSLVDNVRSGTAAISDAYGQMANSVISDVERAQRATASLGNTAAGGLVARNDERVYQEQRGKVAQIEPAALPQLDEWKASQDQLKRDIDIVNAAIKNQERVIASWQNRIDAADKQIEALNDELERMQDAADATSEALSEAQGRLDEYTNAQITGQGAAADAVFENEMAQKRLRLEIMKLEDAAGPIEDIQDKYQKLQGDIDTLRGKRDSLRKAGAGSDILETYDKMIADLERQQGALATTDVSKLEKAQKALEELQRQGEKLDLENSLKFDPLTRQIEKASSKMKEMPFEQIISGIQRESAEVDRLTALQKTQNAAIEAQNDKIKAATQARDVMTDSMEIEQQKLTELNDLQSYLSDNLQAVTGAMDETVSAATDLVAANEEAARAAAELAESNEEAALKAEKAAKAAEEEKIKLDDLAEAAEGAGGALDGLFAEIPDEMGLPPAEEMDIEGWMKEFEDKLNEELGAIELDFNPFDDNFFGNLWHDIVIGIGRWIGGNDVAAEFEKAFQEGSGGIDWWYVITGERGGWSNVWRDIVAGIAWAFIGKDSAAEIERGLQSGSGGIDWWYVFTGERGGWSVVWREFVSGIAKGFLGQNAGAEIERGLDPDSGGIDWGRVFFGERTPWDIMKEIVGDIIEGLAQGFSEKVSSWSDWLAERIPIVRVFKRMLGIESPSTVFKEIGGNILQGLLDGLVEKVESVLQWFRELPGRIFEAIGDLAGWLSRKFDEAITWLREQLPVYVEKVLQWFRELPGRIWEAIGNLGDWLSRKFAEAIQWLRDNLPGQGEKVLQWFRELPGHVANAIGNLGDWLSRKFGEALQWLRDNLPAQAEKVYQWFRELPGNIVGALGDAKTWLIETGRNVLEGLFEGMGGFIERLKRWVADKVPSAIRGPVEDALGIKSPSRVFAEIGRNIGQGLIVGMDGAKSKVQAAAQELANQVANVRLPQMSAAIDPSVLQMPTVGTAPGSVNSGPQAMPKQVQDAVTKVEGILAQHGIVQQGQLTTQAQQFWTAYQGVKNTTLQTFTDMANGQLQITANRDGLLIAGQAQFNGQTISGQVSLRDGVVMLNGDMASQVGSIHGQLSANLTGIQGQLSADIGNIVSGSAQFQTRTNADLAANVGKIIYDAANYQGQVMSTNRDNLNNLTANTNQLVSGNFNNMSNNLANTFNNGITPIFNAFAPMLNTTQGWFQQTVDNIGSIWGGIEPKTADPARFVVNRVYNDGIKTAWNKVNGWLGLPPLEDYVAPFAEGGLVDRNKLVNPKSPRDIRHGGRLNGPASADRTLFAGKGGEYVLTQSMAKDVGYDRLEAWRRAANAGRSVEGAASTFQHPVRALAGGGEVRPGVIDEVFKQLAPYKGSAYDYGGGGGSRGYDCSGWTGAVHKILLGQSPVGRIWTTEVDFASFGYKRGRDGYWSMGVHNGGGGMNSHTAGTLDGINFESGGAHSTSTWGGPAAGTVHPQFENQYVLPALGGVFHGTAGGGVGPTMSQRVEQEYESVMAAIRSATPQPGQGSLSAVPFNSLGKFDIETKKFLMGKAAEYDAVNATMGNTAYDITAGVEQWRGTVHKALDMVGQSRAHDEITLRRMQQESSGNPNAINMTDINAQNGTPSKGLMQVIDPTFQAHKYPGHDDIWAPLDNILASMRYTLSRYGSLPAGYGRAGGYDSGGWLQPGFQTTFNGTAKPEPILTADQWNQIKLVARGAASLVKNIGRAVQWGVGKIFGPNPITDWVRDLWDRWRNPPGNGGGPGGPGTGGPGTGGPGTGGPGTGTPTKPFWADAEAQMKTWTADLAVPIEGLEGVVANLPRKVDEVVVPEWPPVPTIPEQAIVSSAKAAAGEAASAATVASSAATDANVQAITDQYGAAVLGVEATVTAAARSAELNVQAQENTIRANLNTPHGNVQAEATVAPGGDTVNITITGNLEFPGITAQGDVDIFISQLKAAGKR